MVAMVWIGCSKKEHWGEGVDSQKTSLKVTVLNTKDQKPVSGIRTILMRRITESGTFANVDTGRTNAEGIFTYAVSYPNEFKVTIDTTFYSGEEVPTSYNTNEPQEVIMHATPKFGMAPIEVNVIDSISGEPMKDFNLAISYRQQGKLDFISTGGIEKTDENGHVIVSLPWPSEVKIEVPEGGFYAHEPVLATLGSDKGTTVELKIPTDVKVELTVFDAFYKRRLTDIPLKVSLKKEGESEFIEIESDPLDNQGFVSINAAYPAEVKIEFAGNNWFEPANTIVTLGNAIDKPANLLLAIKPPRYPEPNLNNLVIGTLDLDKVGISKPRDVITDRIGNIYITDADKNQIIRVDRKGDPSVLAGKGTKESTDGPGDQAQFNGPWGLAIDKAGNLYTVDNTDGASGGSAHKVRKIVIDEFYNTTVSTIAGSGSSGSTDGIGTAASFNRPAGICYDERRNCLYVTEWGGHRVRKISLEDRKVTTIAGSGTSGVKEGTGVEAQFQIPWGVELSADGNSLYVSSWNGNALSKIDLSNNYVSILGKGKDNLGSARGIYVTPANQVILANTSGNYISKMNHEEEGNMSIFSRIAGPPTGTTAGDTDGIASAARFKGPIGIFYDPYTGIWYIADGDKASRIRTMQSSDIN